jgi:hypothetical protein
MLDNRNIFRGCSTKELISLTIAFSPLGYASTTLIKSNPPDAKLYVDGQIQGETPYFPK